MAISLSYVLKYINNNDLVDFTHNSIRCLRKDVMFVFHFVKFKIFKACSYIAVILTRIGIMHSGYFIYYVNNSLSLPTVILYIPLVHSITYI